MDKIAIIIDTNIFGQPSEYNFNDIRISTFLNSIKGFKNIDIFLPSIVHDEVIKHIKEALETDQKTKMSKYYRDNFDKSFYDNTLKKVSNEFEDMLKKYKIKTIDCNQYINIEEINNWYFNKLKPFEESKPKEFPDAMIISSVKHFFKDNAYTKLYAISDDNGFKEGLERESEFVVFKDINSARKEILGYEDNEIFAIRKYLKENLQVFNDVSKYIFNSYDPSDVIEIDKIDVTKLGDVDLLEHDGTNVTIEVKIDGKLTGDFYIFDPYDSLYDKEDNEYYYMQYRMADEINIDGESIYLEIIKDSKNQIINCNLIDTNEINILKYIEQLEIVYN